MPIRTADRNGGIRLVSYLDFDIHKVPVSFKEEWID